MEPTEHALTDALLPRLSARGLAAARQLGCAECAVWCWGKKEALALRIEHAPVFTRRDWGDRVPKLLSPAAPALLARPKKTVVAAIMGRGVERAAADDDDLLGTTREGIARSGCGIDVSPPVSTTARTSRASVLHSLKRMAIATKRRRATYADVEALPPNVVGEIIDGELFVMPRPKPRHANVIGELSREIGGPFQRGRDGPGGWWILPEPELHLVPDEPVVPDLAGWRRANMPELPDTPKIHLAPDWICEVLSDSTEVHDRRDKMPLYARHGVPHVWLVDPILRYLEAFWNDAGAWRPVGVGKWRDDARVRVAPFEAIEFDLAALWGT